MNLKWARHRPDHTRCFILCLLLLIKSTIQQKERRKNNLTTNSRDMTTTIINNKVQYISYMYELKFVYVVCCTVIDIVFPMEKSWIAAMQRGSHFELADRMKWLAHVEQTQIHFSALLFSRSLALALSMCVCHIIISIFNMYNTFKHTIFPLFMCWWYRGTSIWCETLFIWLSWYFFFSLAFIFHYQLRETVVVYLFVSLVF